MKNVIHPTAKKSLIIGRRKELSGIRIWGLVKVKVRTLVPESLALNGLDPQKCVTQMEVMVADESLGAPKLPDSFFEEASDLAAIAIADSPAIMENSPSSSGIFVDVGRYERHDEAHAYSKGINGLKNVLNVCIKVYSRVYIL